MKKKLTILFFLVNCSFLANVVVAEIVITVYGKGGIVIDRTTGTTTVCPEQSTDQCQVITIIENTKDVMKGRFTNEGNEVVFIIDKQESIVFIDGEGYANGLSGYLVNH